MLRIGNTIRLTEKEREHFRAMTGRPEVPTTVEDYNRAIAVAEKDWQTAESPEGAFLATMVADMRLKDDPQ